MKYFSVDDYKGGYDPGTESMYSESARIGREATRNGYLRMIGEDLEEMKKTQDETNEQIKALTEVLEGELKRIRFAIQQNNTDEL